MHTDSEEGWYLLVEILPKPHPPLRGFGEEKTVELNSQMV